MRTRYYKNSNELEQHGASTCLVVLLHAYTMGPESLITVSKAIQESLPDADIFTPRLPTSIFSRADPVEIAQKLVHQVDHLWQERMGRADGRKYKDIILIGHSLGALLARKLYVFACGEHPKLAPFEPDLEMRQPRPWALYVKRIILLAGMNRGWSVSHHMSLKMAVSSTAGVVLGNLLLLFTQQRPLIFHIRRGAPFLTNLRLQWLAMRDQATKAGNKGCDLLLMTTDKIADLVNEGRNLIIVALVDTNLHIRMFDANGEKVIDKAENQLVPSEALTTLKKQLNSLSDELGLSQEQHQKIIEDTISIARYTPRRLGGALAIQLLGSMDDVVGPEDNIDLVTGADFVYLDVPLSGHSNVIDMDSSVAGGKRKAVFLRALTECRQMLKWHEVQPCDLPLPAKRKDVTDVIFVIHGIRDLGHWTQKIARRVKSMAMEKYNIIYEIETSSYGYFPMLSFLFPWRRRNKVEWFMDQYVETKALYPNAKSSFVGHSNGTYLLAKALQDYPACTFKRIVFAGSVVRCDYRWNEAIKKGQVQAVLNYVATRDWVVACFPKALEMLNLQDLGSAGHDGFSSLDKSTPPSQQIKYVRGGHSAALDERHWDAIARFIVEDDNPVEPPDQWYCPERARWTVVLGVIAPLVWVCIAILAGWLGYSILTSSWPEWARTAGFIAYIGFISKILMRF